MMASDGCDHQSKFDGSRLARSVAGKAESHQALNALANEGSLMMPLVSTFWSPCFGMLTDKFKVSWMVMGPGPTPGH